MLSFFTKTEKVCKQFGLITNSTNARRNDYYFFNLDGISPLFQLPRKIITIIIHFFFVEK